MANTLEHPQTNAPPDAADVRSFVFGLLREWPREREFDAEQILAEHPELALVPSAVAELAIEEYERRTRAGEQVVIEEFAARFPGLEDGLRRELGALDWAQHDEQLASSLYAKYFPEPGESFLGYRLQEVLGQGHCSRVYVARETALGDRTVVVKLCIDGDREAQALGRLEHDGIVPVHSVNLHADSSLVALCMPYLTRATLHDVLVHGFASGTAPARAGAILDAVAAVNGGRSFPALPRQTERWWSRQSWVDAVVDVGIQLAETLSFVHRAGACHGDLKPSNVLVTPGGRALLLDFNLSNWAARDGARGGTLPYMAPEQLQAVLDQRAGRQPARWDVQADLFGLAATLYHLLTGRLPFGLQPELPTLDERLTEMLGRHARGAAPLESHNPQVEARVSRLIAACLSFDPANRPQTADEFAAALRGHFAPARRTVRWVRRHRLRSVAMAVFAVAAIAGLSRVEFGGEAGGRGVTGGSRSGFPGSEPIPDVQVELEKGRAAIRAEEYEAAIEHLNRCLELEPRHLEAMFARGQARLMLGDELLRISDERTFHGQRAQARAESVLAFEQLGEGQADFKAVASNTNNRMAKACAAYCIALGPSSTDEETVRLFLEGVNRFFPTEAAWNNIGYLQLEHQEFQQARQSLESALACNRTLGESHYNLSLVWYKQATVASDARELKLQCLKLALASIERALAVGFSDHEVHLMRGCILVDMSKHLHEQGSSSVEESRPSYYRDLAIESCELAVRLGLPANRLSAIMAIDRSLRDEARFRRMLESSPPVQAPITRRRLICPLSGCELPLSLEIETAGDG